MMYSENRNSPKMFDQNTTRLPLLPEEILGDEILPRLPVKSLSRFKCVSKPWRSLIESDRFIKIHYRNSAKNPRLITMNLNEQRANDRCSLRSLLEPIEESVPTKIDAKASDRLLGCCNGVVCCYDYLLESFSLWNPATRVSAELPDIEGYDLLKWGFGWDESSGAYMVFVSTNRNVCSGWVYNSNTNSWRKSPAGSDRVLRQTGLFLGGNLHWVDGRLPQVECFDLGREEFGRIELPPSNDGVCNPWLGEIRGSLSIIIYMKERLEVWVMKDYGVKDSWLKILTFPSTSLYDHTIYPSIRLLGEGPNGEVFVSSGNYLTVYSPKDDTFSTVTNKDPVELLIYVESLVSPKRILELDATNTTS